MAEVIENFFGCYLLVSENPKCKGHCYIGFTVDPNRRVNQHNKGLKAGGAKKTSTKGPWLMVLIVHGFPNEISALRFEWAWQHPKRSRRLRHLPAKRTKETRFEFSIRILSQMLRLGPWNRLPLTIRWLSKQHAIDFPPDQMPPEHMPIAYGPVKSKKVKIPAESTLDSVAHGDELNDRCDICQTPIMDSSECMSCLSPGCKLKAHTTCLSQLFLKLGSNFVIPVDGNCPKCHHSILWGDLVRYKKGCYQDLAVEVALEDLS